MLEHDNFDSRPLFVLAICGVVGMFLVANVIGTAFIMNLRQRHHSEAIIYGGGAGFILAQISLLTLWGVLGSESLIYRFPRSAGLGIAIFLSWVAGTHLADIFSEFDGNSVPNSIAVVLSLFGLLFFSLLSAPLWLVRRLSPMRIWHPSQLPGTDQFTIGQLFVWTAAVAVCVAVGTQIFQNGDSVESLPPAGLLWQMMFMVAGISIFTAAMGTPLLWGVLAPKPAATTWAVIGIVFLIGPPTFMVLIYFLNGQSPGGELVYALLAWYAFYLVMMLVMVGCLLLVRAFGFRFTTPKVETHEFAAAIS